MWSINPGSQVSTYHVDPNFYRHTKSWIFTVFFIDKGNESLLWEGKTCLRRYKNTYEKFGISDQFCFEISLVLFPDPDSDRGKSMRIRMPRIRRQRYSRACASLACSGGTWLNVLSARARWVAWARMHECTWRAALCDVKCTVSKWQLIHMPDSDPGLYPKYAPPPRQANSYQTYFFSTSHAALLPFLSFSSPGTLPFFYPHHQHCPLILNNDHSASFRPPPSPLASHTALLPQWPRCPLPSPFPFPHQPHCPSKPPSSFPPHQPRCSPPPSPSLVAVPSRPFLAFPLNRNAALLKLMHPLPFPLHQLRCPFSLTFISPASLPSSPPPPLQQPRCRPPNPSHFHSIATLPSKIPRCPLPFLPQHSPLTSPIVLFPFPPSALPPLLQQSNTPPLQETTLASFPFFPLLTSYS